MAKKKNYVNNREFYDALGAWKEDGFPLPIPSYIVTCFLEITRRIGTTRNFNAYPFLDDMKSEAVEHCLKGATKFNGDLYDNPFAYFSKFVYNAFFQYIKKEKKLVNYKFKEVQEVMENSYASNRDWIVGSNRNDNGDVIDEFDNILTTVEDLRKKGCY